jgi:beta-glucuronidase
VRRLWFAISLASFLLGLAGIALTAYLWFGDWPAETRELVDHYRSVAENTARPPEPLIGNVRGRQTTSLAGRWPAVIDLYSRAELGGMAPRGLAPEAPSDLGEFSFEDGLTLEVPGDWNTQDPRLVFYQGVVWYKREFELPPAAAGERTFLWFGAANYRASVYLNGQLVGGHEGGFTPFNYEVTDRLGEGMNLLVVKVDNRKGPEDVPTALTDWHNYGGLTRDVFALRTPASFIRNYSLELGGDGRILGSVELDGSPFPESVSVSLPELGASASAAPDAGGIARFELEATPERWSPESPRLYEVEVRAGDDSVRDEIGFRSIEAAGSEILLNGEPIFLRGISIHEEAPHGEGRIHSREQAETLLGWARDLGCNFVRLAHYPHSEHMLRLADRLGLLVWGEVPVYWNVAFESPRARERTRRQLSELIARDRNRASVILWSIGNETPIGEARQAFMAEMADHVRTLDPTRLVTAALVTSPDSLARFFLGSYVPALMGLDFGSWVYTVGDPLAEIVDVPALNQYFGWYYSGALASLTPVSSHRARRVMIDHIDRIRIQPGTDKPLVMSELGAGARLGMRAPEAELAAYSEEYQALVYRKQIAMLREQPTLRGMSPWLLKDFRSPLRLYQGVQDYWNRKGLVDDEGRRKLAFEVLRDHYRERAGEDAS